MNTATCERFASALGGTWEPVAWQGVHSYTLRNKEKEIVLQFRGPTEPLDDRMTDLAAKIYPRLAPDTKYLGELPNQPGQSDPSAQVKVWQMTCIPGDPFLFHATSLTREHVSQAAIGLAKFFARAWEHPQPHATVQANYYIAALRKLLATLPVEFSTVIDFILIHLDDILTLPPTLTHADISSGNTLIDPETGCITGIVDWAGATIEPFGLALWGLQEIIGYHGPKGYSYLYNDKTNRRLFRDAFLRDTRIKSDDNSLLQRLEWAGLLGVLLHFGYTWDSIEQKRVPITTQRDLKFLKTCIQASLFDDNVIFDFPPQEGE